MKKVKQTQAITVQKNIICLDVHKNKGSVGVN